MTHPQTHPILTPVPNPTLDDLAAALLSAKAVLTTAQKAVYAAEDALVAAVGAEDEGSFTVCCDGYKVGAWAGVLCGLDGGVYSGQCGVGNLG